MSLVGLVLLVVAGLAPSGTDLSSPYGPDQSRAACVSAVTTTPVPSPEPTGLKPYPAWGISQGYQPLELSADRLGLLLDGITATGVKVLRLDLPWGQIQGQRRGCFDFTRVLQVYDAARARGLTVLPVTSGLPSWTAVGRGDFATSFELFLQQAGEVLIPRGITAVELWNEANLTGLSPATYTEKVLRPGSVGFRRAGHELGRPVTVITSGPGPAATGGGRWSQLDFVRGVYAAGGRPYFDVLATHPYVWPADPAVPSRWNWLQKTVELRAVMERNGDSGKQIWATEFGWPTNQGRDGVDEQTQARYLERGVAIWRSHPWAGLLVFYSYEDLDGSATDPESHFGLVTRDGRAKPSLATVRDLVAG